MIRSGYYTIFEGKEFRIDGIEDGSYELISFDSLDQKYGFLIYSPISLFYFKKVTKKDVGYVYLITTFAAYKGHKYNIESEKDGKFFISTDDDELLKEFDLEFIDRGFYAKYVDKNEVTLFEEKEMSPNFFDND